ncbi:MAG: alanine racemase [Actinobacteria bacterium]|nr:alanine racemase [Actinomycetota bacterium]
MSARAAWIEVDLDAVRHNVSYLSSLIGDAKIMVVVKANGYGHGAIQVAQAALEAGAHGLCVALVQEGVELRRAGIEAPILVFSEQPLDQIGEMISHGLIATAYSVGYIDALEHQARIRGVIGHCKPADAVELGGRILARAPELVLGGVYTHLASADDSDTSFTDTQIARFDSVLGNLQRAGIETGWVHIANSAATLRRTDVYRDLVRVGIAMYGIAPAISMDAMCSHLRQALSLKSRVSFIKKVSAGEGISYGQRYQVQEATRIATVPLGYADGVPRRLSGVGGEVLIAGQRFPIVGRVTMDQLMVDIGNSSIAVGDEVVLLGSQGQETITPNDWGELLDTIGYEIVCGLSARLARVYC